MANLKEARLASPPLSDLVARLRMLADNIEKGAIAADSAVIVICTEPRVGVYGFGRRCSMLEATGWLHRALSGIAEGYSV